MHSQLQSQSTIWSLLLQSPGMYCRNVSNINISALELSNTINRARRWRNYTTAILLSIHFGTLKSAITSVSDHLLTFLQYLNRVSQSVMGKPTAKAIIVTIGLLQKENTSKCTHHIFNWPFLFKPSVIDPRVALSTLNLPTIAHFPVWVSMVVSWVCFPMARCDVFKFIFINLHSYILCKDHPEYDQPGYYNENCVPSPLRNLSVLGSCDFSIWPIGISTCS